MTVSVKVLPEIPSEELLLAMCHAVLLGEDANYNNMHLEMAEAREAYNALYTALSNQHAEPVGYVDMHAFSALQIEGNGSVTTTINMEKTDRYHYAVFTHPSHSDSARNAVLEEAARNLLANRSSTYKSRNGRLCSLEGDDGEKCWIVSFDDMADLENALQTKPEGE